MLVVDDVPLFRAGLIAALTEAGYEVVGEAASAEAGVAAAEIHHPDLVLLDVLMPGLSGIDVVEKISAVSPSSVVVLLTASESEEDLLAGLKAGARGYIVKDTPFPQLVEAIQAVAGGGASISPQMAGKLFDVARQLLRHQELLATRKPTLTGREIEVLQHVAAGMTSRRIGEVLYISENTVKNHIRNILDKLGLHSRNEAVLYAVRENLISLG
ncbi:MAG: response regulator transcription factor [Acidimicrobiia bacterium]|nr:response regulator transcription factor [Acidimicrobiia bacterium]MBT8214812.1 response regulator transcription factor [Acidimicrobiia bacterium]NNF68315.1 response regulator transcription factor [Acidimicrobiia bacterium]NNK92584.1 response regulator transcription factor [Acidimicrobiia bacterium]